MKSSWFDQSIKLVCGGARHGGGQLEVSGLTVFASKCVRVFSDTTGFSIQAMILTAPPQTGQVPMSIPKTRSRRCTPRSSRRGVRPVSARPNPRFRGGGSPGPAWLVSPARSICCWARIHCGNGSNIRTQHECKVFEGNLDVLLVKILKKSLRRPSSRFHSKK